MKVFAISVWLFFTLCAIFALLLSAHECASVSRPNLFWLTAETQSGQKPHKKRSKLTALSVLNLGKTAKRPNPSPEAESPSVDGDIRVKIVKLASEKKSEALAKYLPTVHSESLQKFIVHNIVPDCDTCLDALVWALTSSSAYEQAANKLRGKVLFSVRERLFKSLLENKDNLTEREGNALAVISLLSKANDDRERKMMIALVNSDLPPSLRVAALKCFDPPFTQAVKDTLISAVSNNNNEGLSAIILGVAALEKIKESPFAEAVPVLARIVISYPDEFVFYTHFEDGEVRYRICRIKGHKVSMIETLGKAGTPEAKTALVEIAAADTLPEFRLAALRQVHSLDSNLAVSIAKDAFLSQECPEKREFARTLSSFMDDIGSEEFFTSVALNDSDSGRRAAAVEILAGMSSIDRVAETLLQIACNDSNWSLRREAVYALARNNSAQVQRALIEIAASDSDCDVRGAAINSLDLSFPESVPALMQIAADTSGNYYGAMRKLSSTGSPEVGEFLLSILQEREKDSDSCSSVYYHAEHAAGCLRDMGGEYRVAAFREVLSGQGFRRWDRLNWATMAADYPEPEIEWILRDSARNDPDGGVRDAAVNSLQRIYEKQEEELVKSRLASVPDASQER